MGSSERLEASSRRLPSGAPILPSGGEKSASLTLNSQNCLTLRMLSSGGRAPSVYRRAEVPLRHLSGIKPAGLECGPHRCYKASSGEETRSGGPGPVWCLGVPCLPRTRRRRAAAGPKSGAGVAWPEGGAYGLEIDSRCLGLEQCGVPSRFGRVLNRSGPQHRCPGQPSGRKPQSSSDSINGSVPCDCRPVRRWKC